MFKLPARELIRIEGKLETLSESIVALTMMIEVMRREVEKA